jgi:AraC-like DNA-binding protein
MEKELHIRLLHCGIPTIDKRWNYRNVYDNYWRMYIHNRDGAGALFSGQRCPIPKNRVVFIPAWVRFTCYNCRPIQSFYVHFDVVGLGDQLIRKIFNRPFSLDSKTDFARTTAPLNRRTDDTAYLCRVKSLVYRYFSELLAGLPALQAEEIARSLTAQNRFAATLHYIDHHLAEPLTNDRLARLSHMSESNFAHCFKDLMGQSPARFVLQRRIVAAARALIFTRDAIDDVAECTGFPNRFHFSRNFKKLMGVTPAAYRKTTRV